MVADNELLTRSVTDPTYVRGVFTSRQFLGIGASDAARTASRRVYDNIAREEAAFPVTQPEIEGGAFIIDFRITKTITGGRFKRQLEDVANPGWFAQQFLGQGSLGKIAIELERIPRSALSRTNVAAVQGRHLAAQEAEDLRRSTTTSIPDLGRNIFKGLNIAKGAAIAGVLVALVVAFWPALLAAGKAGGFAINKGRKRK